MAHEMQSVRRLGLSECLRHETSLNTSCIFFLCANDFVHTIYLISIECAHAHSLPLRPFGALAHTHQPQTCDGKSNERCPAGDLKLTAFIVSFLSFDCPFVSAFRFIFIIISRSPSGDNDN